MAEGDLQGPSRREVFTRLFKPKETGQSPTSSDKTATRTTEAPKTKPALARRQLLEGLAILGISAIAGGDKKDPVIQAVEDMNKFQPATEYPAKTPKENFWGRPPLEYTRDQLCIESNPRLKEGLGKHKQAIVIVHAGFVDYTIAEIQKNIADDPLKKLIESLIWVISKQLQQKH